MIAAVILAELDYCGLVCLWGCLLWHPLKRYGTCSLQHTLNMSIHHLFAPIYKAITSWEVLVPKRASENTLQFINASENSLQLYVPLFLSLASTKNMAS